MGKNVTDVGRQKKELKTELKKHAATIHCSNSLSLLQRKISNALLYHAYEELMVNEEHVISVKQLCRLIGYHGNNHAVIKDALKALISIVIEWNLIDDKTGVENWTASSIIASVSLQGPLCFYAYSPRMKQLLHSPSMFGKIDLVIQSHFRSSYGLALYENCIRYRGLPYTKWFEMDLFKKLMGIPNDMYAIFRDFKRRVLDKAVDEVNTYSDLVIASEYVREGRKVVRVRFKLKERAKKARLGHPPLLVEKNKTPPPNDKFEAVLSKNFGLSKEQISFLLNEFDAAFIQEKMVIIEGSKAYQEGKVTNLPGLLLSAARNNYQSPPPVSKKEVPVPTTNLIELKREVEAIRKAYHAYREELIHDTINELSIKNREALLEEFNEYVSPVISTILQLQPAKYTRQNVLASPQVQALLRQFALRHLDFGHLITLEQFAAKQEAKKKASWDKLKAYDPEHPLLKFT